MVLIHIYYVAVTGSSTIIMNNGAVLSTVRIPGENSC
jgi:hypothetical protein